MDLNRLRVFQVVAERLSFTAAAQLLKLDKGRVSRIIAALEEELGHPLLIRSTRSMRLLPEGHALLQQVKGPLETLRAATERTVTQAPEGRVVLATTPELARVLLAPVLAAFRLHHPRIHVELRVSATLADLSEVDLAVRVGTAAPSDWVVSPLGALESGFFAAPSYVERRGLPRTWADLRGHDGLWPTPPKTAKAFRSPHQPSAPAIDCGDFQVLQALAVAGAGVALIPTFLATSDVAAGRLVRVLPEVTLGNAPLRLLSPPKRLAAARVTLLRDFLRHALAPR